MTLEEAKEHIAKKYGFENWYKLYLSKVFNLKAFEKFTDEAAELYAKSKVVEANVCVELLASCVNNFEKPEYCSHRNNHLCQKCKDW